LRSVESVGEGVDGCHEVVELVLQLSDGGGCVVGGFGFVAHPGGRRLDGQPAAGGPFEHAERRDDDGDERQDTLGVQQDGEPSATPGSACGVPSARLTTTATIANAKVPSARRGLSLVDWAVRVMRLSESGDGQAV
jgi:hypothetical protein